MALRTVGGHRIGEDGADLKAWLRDLTGCPTITHTLAAACRDTSHGGDAAIWFYVEGDPQAGVGRRRCVGCAGVVPILDSEEHWSYPPMWACDNCRNSLAEVAYGAHAEPGEDGVQRVTWLAMAARCVNCGRLEGITDVRVPSLTLDEVGLRI